MTDLEFLVFVPIAGICFLIGAGLKAIGNETLDRFIPILCAISGGILSIVAFYTIPNFIPASNWMGALYIGGGSGFAATGLHQVYKQFKKGDDNLEFTTDDELPVEDPENEPNPDESEA